MFWKERFFSPTSFFEHQLSFTLAYNTHLLSSMEPFDDTDGWTRVSRRRNRARDERRRSPQPTSFPGEHRQQHTRRSYASVAREGQRSHLQRPREWDSHSRTRHHPSRPPPVHRRRGDGWNRPGRERRHHSSGFPPPADRRRPWGTGAEHRQQRYHTDRYPPARPRRYFDQGSGRPNYRYDAQRQQNHTQNVNPNWVQSDDPAFTQKVRIIYRIIKSNHHLKNVTGKHPPPTIRKTTNSLIDLIKPAFPNDNTSCLLEGNAKNWEHTTILILKQHYEDSMNQEIQDLAEFPTREWEGPFRVASAWATRNLGPRLKTETLQDTKAFLKANLNEHVPPETEDAQTPAETDPAPLAAPTAPSSTLQVQRKVTVQAMIHAGTMTDQTGGDWSPDRPEVQALPPPTSPPLPPPLSPLPPRSRLFPLFTSQGSQARDAETHPGTAEAQGETTTARIPPALPLQPHNTHNPCVRLDDSNIQADDDTESGSSHPSRGRSGAGTIRLTPTSAGATSETRGTGLLRPRQRKSRGTSTPRTAIAELSPEEVDSLLQQPDSPLQFTTPPTPTRRPTRHMNTDRKLQDWGLCVKEKRLFIGDSNLTRFPPFQPQNLQIDSYPGATFRHAESILKKAVCLVQPDTVVLAFGLNNRKQKTRVTAVQQLRRAVKMARDKFPQATIRVPIINYSPRLPMKERLNLQALNNHIGKSFDFIPELSDEHFVTDNDDVHWTRVTASKMFAHWVQHLN